MIRKLGNYWIKNGSLPISTHGCHQKTKSFIDDEDIINCSLTYIRANGGKTAPQDYKKFVETKIFPQITVNKSISTKTARIWLHKLGLTPQSRKKGIYFDGHEREDVIQYRQQFLKTMEKYEKLMPTFIGDEMQMVLPELKEDEKLHILITHDECLFYANDDCPIVWAPLGEPPLRKKGQGKSLMVSEFLLETIGRLKFTDEFAANDINIPKEARKFLRPGKNEEGWWTSEHLIDQVVNYAIPIFKQLYPNAIGVFAFDNSTNHGAMAKDGLNAFKMNMNPEGKCVQLIMDQIKLFNLWFFHMII